VAVLEADREIRRRDGSFELLSENYKVIQSESKRWKNGSERWL